MIQGFADKRTERFHAGNSVKAFSGFERPARRKLNELDAAMAIRDLDRPGSRLEALGGNRKGQWSIRINKRWRICFEWPRGSNGPTNVEIVDYH